MYVYGYVYVYVYGCVCPSGYKLSGGVTELEPYMVCLDRVTQDPRLLMMLVSAAHHVGVTWDMT